MRTTFIIAEVAGPSVPWSAVEPHVVGDPSVSPEYARLSRLYDISRTHNCKHRAGAWSRAALERLAAKSGVTITNAYWTNYDSRNGYAGAVEHSII